MVQNEKLARVDGEFGVSSSFIITKFNFVSPVQQLDYRTYLSAY